MKGVKEEKFNLPIEIKFLFDNSKLDALTYLVILYSIKKNTRKKFTNLEQLLYYYTIVNQNIDTAELPLINKQLVDGQKILKLLIYLSNFDYLSVEGSLLSKKSDLKIKITDMGFNLVENWESVYIRKFVDGVCEKMLNDPYDTSHIIFNKKLYGVESND